MKSIYGLTHAGVQEQRKFSRIVLLPVHDIHSSAPSTIAWGWLPALSVSCAAGLLSVAHAYTSSRLGAPGSAFFFWAGILLMFVPVAVRLLSRLASRGERLGLLCVLGMSFYVVVILYAPLYFTSFDEFLHWRTAADIARSRHLFGQNAMFPVGPFYPGLEVVTNALSSLAGLSTFQAAIVVVGVARFVMVLSLFMLFEKIVGSARIAGIATILYMANPQFLFFDAGFSYESLALPLATFALFMLVGHEKPTRENYWMMLCVWITLGAVVVTHHMTSFVFTGLLLLWVAAYAWQHSGRLLLRSTLAKTALFMLCASIAWTLLKGNPVVSYLSFYFGDAAKELGHIVAGASSARHLFVDYSGSAPTPLWERWMTICSVAIILLCLPFALFRVWKHYRNNVLICLFGLAALCYPASQLFRFTNFGPEIATRAMAFCFLPIACILAIFLTQGWLSRLRYWPHTLLISCALAVLLLGGITSPPWVLLPGPYMVGADDRSIGPEGIQSALWAHAYLGPDNRVATDRTDRLLMGTYGDQRIINGLADSPDVSPLFFSTQFGPADVAILRSDRVGYLVVDQRLSEARPSVGVYFEPGEPGSYAHRTPIAQQALTKFNAVPQINRVFDSGNIVIYGVR